MRWGGDGNENVSVSKFAPCCGGEAGKGEKFSVPLVGGFYFYGRDGPRKMEL